MRKRLIKFLTLYAIVGIPFFRQC